MPLDSNTIVGVVGAGAMGTGIAQVAAGAGHQVILGDGASGATPRAQAHIAKAMEREVEKGRCSRDDCDALLSRIDYVWEPLAGELTVYRKCGLVIEAVVEDLDTKRALVRRLEGTVSRETILATNTSSLSIASIASSCEFPARVLGLHFFNPAPIMALVEVVPWLGGDPFAASAAHAMMRRWNKTPVFASDTPGFIVNRIARPFYGEALRLLEEGVADAPTIDWAVKQFGGFRMGPFELMDFIGNDVNFAVTRSVFEGSYFEPRYRPSITQRRLVESGFLGRKTGRGYYDYAPNSAPPAAKTDPAVGQAVFERILAMLVNEAVDAVHMRVASPADVDLAMTKGVNYPKGLLAWGNELGLSRVLDWLDQLYAEYAEDRYRASVLLRRMVRDNTRFFE